VADDSAAARLACAPASSVRAELTERKSVATFARAVVTFCSSVDTVCASAAHGPLLEPLSADELAAALSAALSPRQSTACFCRSAARLARA